MKLHKDAAEHVVLEQFRSAYPLFPKGVIRKGRPGTEPDFVVEDQSDVFGIELACLYRDEGKDWLGVQHQGLQQEKLVQTAREIFQSLTNERRRVYISFNERSGITKKTLAKMAEFLASKVLTAIKVERPSVDGLIDLGGSQLYPYESCFRYIQIFDRRYSIDHRWSIFNAFDVESLNLKILTTRISEKENKLLKGNYYNISKIWLLLYIDFRNHATDQQLPTSIDFHIKSSNFEKIIIFKTFENTHLTIYPDFGRMENV